MLKDLDSLKTVIKPEKVCIDNKIFKLHTKLTFILLVGFSLALTCKQYVGEPIECVVHKEPLSKEVMNSYCWIHSTFTVPKWIDGRIGKDVSHPGVSSYTDRDEIKYHSYYQWVCFVLFFQAVLFYIPRYLWKTWERGLIKNMLQSLGNPVLDEETRTKEKKKLAEYLYKSLRHHKSYAVRFFICEALNFVNVFGQIYLMDSFLGGEFTTYGYSVIGFSEMQPEDRGDPMSFVFPKVTKCTFHMFGASGSVQTIDSLCVLALNILNEKIYIFLFFWFGLLSIISGLELVYRACLFCSRTMRLCCLCYNAGFTHHKEIETITQKCDIGDCFILCQLSKNMDLLTFQELIGLVYERLIGKSDSTKKKNGALDQTKVNEEAVTTDYLKVSKECVVEIV
ncbi:Innexin inx2 [Frankliniella fusca]|uniref:Innexin n=1 Tax=Frankliniella fusca TaxID=407009 RepID=A0AAE1LQN8_9NEOP|nr:Innexin inx2 [Frankliniella fusca]